MKTDIREFSLGELKDKMAAMGQPAHRAKQIFRWLYKKLASDLRSMTDIPKDLVLRLGRELKVGALHCEERLVSRDGTEKFLWKLEDGEYIESVLIKGAAGKDARTLCVSTQVGCRFKCPFCASGKKDLARDLGAAEILDQIICVQRLSACRVSHVVFMGMGEPLDNYDNLIKAIRVMNDPEGMGIGARKITVSTCGIAPAIRRLKGLGLQVELAVSLHAAEDALRDKLVPANRKYPLKELERALAEYIRDTGRVVTLEYTLIRGVNDSDKDAEKLAGFAKKVKAKVNLIACNLPASEGVEKLKPGRIETFRKILARNGVTATIRRSRGEDIMAACGQLAARKREEKGHGSRVMGQG